MPFEKGDFLLVEYSLRLKDTNMLIDTTNEDEAKKEGVYDESRVYGPQLVIVGEGRLIKGLEEAIASMNVGEEKTVEIPPSKAYGERDPSKIKVMRLKDLYRRGIVPEPGKFIEIDGQIAKVVAVTGGRVTVDFNHPFAGRTIVARVKVIAKLENDDDKVRYLVARRLNVKPEEVEVELDKEKGVVKCKLGVRAALKANPSTKLLAIHEISQYFDWVKKVVFIEEFEVKRSESSSG